MTMIRFPPLDADETVTVEEIEYDRQGRVIKRTVKVTRRPKRNDYVWDPPRRTIPYWNEAKPECNVRGQ